MILILTLNPLLEFRYTLPVFHPKHNNRNASFTNVVGGKGINVSRQLKILGVDSFNFLFAGSLYGKKIKELLEQESLKSTTVRTKHDNRTASVIIETGEQAVSTVFAENQPILDSEAAEYIEKLDKMIQNCEILICSGSSPNPACDGIFPAALKLAREYDKIAVLDTYGTHFQACLEQSPTIVHNTLAEIQTPTGGPVQSTEEITAYLQYLYEQGVKQAFLTNGSESFYASTFDYFYKVTPPAIEEFDPTGSGDAFTAGIIYCHFYDLTFDQALRLAAGLGAANAASDQVCKVSQEEADELGRKAVIEPIGKRMKIVDVTPTI